MQLYRPSIAVILYNLFFAISTFSIKASKTYVPWLPLCHAHYVGNVHILFWGRDLVGENIGIYKHGQMVYGSAVIFHGTFVLWMTELGVGKLAIHTYTTCFICPVQIFGQVSLRQQWFVKNLCTEVVISWTSDVPVHTNNSLTTWYSKHASWHVPCFEGILEMGYVVYLVHSG